MSYEIMMAGIFLRNSATRSLLCNKRRGQTRVKPDCSFAAHFRVDDRKFTHNLGEAHPEPTFNKSFNRIRVGDTAG